MYTDGGRHVRVQLSFPSLQRIMENIREESVDACLIEEELYLRLRFKFFNILFSIINLLWYVSFKDILQANKFYLFNSLHRKRRTCDFARATSPL